MRTRPTEKKDLPILSRINSEIIRLRRSNLHPFSFLMDSGDRDNAIGFIKSGNVIQCTKPVIEGIQYDEIYIPDLLCYKHRLIIEYNETPVGSKNHNKRKKGHVDESYYDKTKIDTYLKAGFSVLVIYDFEMKDNNKDSWKNTLKDWLIKASNERATKCLTM